MANSLPPIKLPPRSGGAGKKNDFDRFVAKNGLGKYKATIQQWAGEFGVSALWIAATIKFEGGTPGKLNASGRGFGLAQIDPKTWFGHVFPPTGETITAAWASQASNAIAFMSWLYSRSTAATLEGAYKQVYNPGYTGQANDPNGLGPSSLTKGYTDTVRGTTPAQKAAGSAATAQASAANLANQTAQAKSLLDPTYLAYTGRPALQAQIAAYLKAPKSLYQIQQELTDPKLNPAIYKSAIWKTGAPGYMAVYHSIYGEQAVAPKQLILQALAHNVGDAGFAEQLRQRPDYAKSVEYRNAAASFGSAYDGIYGTPADASEAAKVKAAAIDQAVRGGWNQDQWGQYLRRQPAYQQSAEFKTLNINLAQRMGLISGATGQTMLQQVQAEAAAPAPTPPAPPAPLAAPEVQPPAAAPPETVTEPEKVPQPGVAIPVR